MDPSAAIDFRVLTAGMATALLLTASLLFRWRLGIGLVVGCLATVYVLPLAARGADLDLLAPLVAGGLLAVAELSFWSIETRASINEATEVARGRVPVLALSVGAACGLGLLVEELAHRSQIQGDMTTLGLAFLAGLGAISLVALTAATWHRNQP